MYNSVPFSQGTLPGQGHLKRKEVQNYDQQDILISVFMFSSHFPPGPDESVLTNLRQYGLESQFVDMLVADAAKSAWKQQEVFDAILTDRKDYSESHRGCNSGGF